MHNRSQELECQPVYSFVLTADKVIFSAEVPNMNRVRSLILDSQWREIKGTPLEELEIGAIEIEAAPVVLPVPVGTASRKLCHYLVRSFLSIETRHNPPSPRASIKRKARPTNIWRLGTKAVD